MLGARRNYDDVPLAERCLFFADLSEDFSLQYEERLLAPGMLVTLRAAGFSGARVIIAV